MFTQIKNHPDNPVRRIIPADDRGETMCELCRRSFLGGLATIGTAGFMPKAFAQGVSDARFERPSVTLPPRGECFFKLAADLPASHS